MSGTNWLDLSRVIDKLDVPDQEKEDVKRWINEKTTGQIQILIAGRTGVGKSSLVNALSGKQVAKTGETLSAETKNVTRYTVKAEEGLEVVFWLSHGLKNGSDNKEYFDELKSKCSNVEMIIYSIKLAATRSGEEAQNDVFAIEKLTAIFGQNCWERSIFVMTFANTLEARLRVKPDFEKKFNDRLKEWKERMHTALLKAGVPKEVADKVPVEPAGHPLKPHLPGRDNWLSALWFTILKRALLQSRPESTQQNVYQRESEPNTTPPKDADEDEHPDPQVKLNNTKCLASTRGLSRIGIVTAIGAGAGATLGLLGGGGGAAVGLIVGGAIGLAASLLIRC